MNWETLKNDVEIVRKRKIVGELRLIPSYGIGKPVLRFDDECGNGHNTFSITVDGGESFGGCMHDSICEVWPEYARLTKWHLVSTDGPLHYVSNTRYHARNAMDSLDSDELNRHWTMAKNVAIAPRASLSKLSSERWLLDRLPALMDIFAEFMDMTFQLNQPKRLDNELI